MARRTIFGLIATLALLVFSLPALGTSHTVLMPDANPSNAESNQFEHEWPYPKRPFPESSSPVGPVTGGPGNNEGKPVNDPQRKATLLVRAKELGSAAEVVQADAKGMLKLTATSTSGPVALTHDGNDFMLPVHEAATWRIQIDIKNVSPENGEEWVHWYLSMDFGPNLRVIEKERGVWLAAGENKYKEDFEISDPDDETGLTHLKWSWQQNGNNKFAPGSTAYLILDVSADGLQPGSQPQLFCEGISLEYNLEGKPVSVPLNPIYIWVREEPYADISVTATCLDWRVQKPGTYAALATEITMTGKGSISVQFEGFDNLTKVGGGSGHIPAFYAFDEDLPIKVPEAWTSAPQLNDPSNWLEPITLDPVKPSCVHMWARIDVGEEISSAEYENEGVITFIISNI